MHSTLLVNKNRFLIHLFGEVLLRSLGIFEEETCVFDYFLEILAQILDLGLDVLLLLGRQLLFLVQSISHKLVDGLVGS